MIGKKIKRILTIAVLSYIAVIVFMYLQQGNLMYLPDRADQSPARTTVPEMQEIRLTTTDQMTNESWLWLPEDVNAKVVVMFHGNASNIGGRAFKARHFIDAGLGFVLTGYRGYGGNPGTPSEDGLYNDARAVMAELVDRRGIAPSRIVLYGESLGTGVAIKMATEYPGISGLVLEVPFFSALNVAQQEYWYIIGLETLMKDKYRSDLRIGALTMPKLFVAAGREAVVPPDQARKLFDAALEPKQFIEIPAGSHNNLYDYGAGDMITTFVRDLP